MCCIFLLIFCEVANHFVAVREIWVVKGIVSVVEGLNIINLYAIDVSVTGQQPKYVVLCVQYEKLITFKMLCSQISNFCALQF